MSPRSVMRCAFLASILTVTACAGSGGGSASPGLGSAKLAWTAPTTNTDGSPLSDLSGYRIYYGTAPSSLGRRIDVNNPSAITWTVTDLAPGTWYFALTAVNNGGYESVRTNVVSTMIR